MFGVVVGLITVIGPLPLTSITVPLIGEGNSARCFPRPFPVKPLRPLRPGGAGRARVPAVLAGLLLRVVLEVQLLPAVHLRLAVL